MLVTTLLQGFARCDVRNMLKEGVGGECEVDSRTMPAISQQNDGTCSFLQAGPRIWGVWRQSIERGKQGRFGQKQIYLDQKILDLDFVLECLRTAL